MARGAEGDGPCAVAGLTLSPGARMVGPRGHSAGYRGLDNERLGTVLTVWAIELGNLLAVDIVGVEYEVDAALHYAPLDNHVGAGRDAIAMSLACADRFLDGFTKLEHVRVDPRW